MNTSSIATLTGLSFERAHSWPRSVRELLSLPDQLPPSHICETLQPRFINILWNGSKFLNGNATTSTFSLDIAGINDELFYQNRITIHSYLGYSTTGVVACTQSTRVSRLPLRDETAILSPDLQICIMKPVCPGGNRYYDASRLMPTVVNIHSHLWGAVLFGYLLLTFYPNYVAHQHGASWIDVTVFAIFLVSAVFCLLASATLHAFTCHSPKVRPCLSQKVAIRHTCL